MNQKFSQKELAQTTPSIMNPDAHAIFFEIHHKLPQEGPGSDVSTLRALRSVKDLNPKPKVLDLGCGPGRQTLALAKALNASITAVDNHQVYLDELHLQLKNSTVRSEVKTCHASMDKLPFKQGYFDLIWSEGAAYIMGVENALSYWRQFLKASGYLAITELSWLKAPAGNEAESFFAKNYPEMKSWEDNLTLMQTLSYKIVDSFVLPREDWITDYYKPLEKRITQLEQKYATHKAALEVLSSEKQEIDLFQRFSDFYGYVFYILQKQN